MKLVRFLIVAIIILAVLGTGCSSAPDKVYSDDDLRGTTRVTDEK